jgi:cytochrome c556
MVGSIILIQQTLVQGQEKAHEPAYIVRKPPASLDQYYPPKAEGPQYLFAMFGIEGQFAGMATHIADGDLTKAQEYFKTFEAEYQKVAKMVPEWSVHYWPEKPINDLSAALESGDQQKIGAAMPGLMQACVRCHQETMTAVWARYGKSMEQVEEFMFPLMGSFAAVSTYSAEGEFDKARKALEVFQERMDEFSESCASCHDTERSYYVSSDVQALLKTAADALEEETPNVEQIVGTMQNVGMESCYKCHKVHIPISNIQKAWAAEK